MLLDSLLRGVRELRSRRRGAAGGGRCPSRAQGRLLRCEPLEDRQLLSAIPPLGEFHLFADASLTTPGLVGSYVNQSLRSYAPQDDWRLTQAIAGTRVDAAINFTSNGWGSRNAVGLTHGSNNDWDNFSVQWDGYVQTIDHTTGLATRSDDSSRMWIDLNGDGRFDSSGPEFVNNHWGSAQGATTGPSSPPLAPGAYRVRIQYEASTGANVMQLLPIVEPQVRVAYVIPSNRTPQADGVANLQYSMEVFQAWYRDQMERNGFGPKTFVYETEPDGTTPLIHVVNVAQTDDYLRGDIWGRVGQAAADAGVPIWASGQVWLLMPEIHVENPDGSIVGGVCLGASNASGSGSGVAMVGTNGLVVMNGADLVNNTPYNGLVIPDLGPYPLVKDVSFVWFEGSTLSSLSSSYLGATLHETSHGFGLNHDFRNDSNFHGDLMGNGLRGMRGAIYPNLYPSDDTFLSYGQALALSTSRYFNPVEYAPETNSPAISVSTTGSVVPVNGLLDISFAASDDTGLSCALLLDNGDQIGEMTLSGTSTTSTFETPYYTKGQTDSFTVRVYDVYGNRRDASVSITPTTGYNAAPKPFVRLSTSTLDVGQSLLLSASSTSDPDDPASSLTVEWDLNGDGVFDTVPTTTKTLTLSFAEAGTRLIRARITDPHGAQSLSTPIAIRIFGAPTDITLSPSGVAENQPAGTVVGTFTTSDPNPAHTFTYALVSGDGDSDNASFTIDGNQLKTAAEFDYETRSSYTIRVRTTDQDGSSYEKALAIAVWQVNPNPGSILGRAFADLNGDGTNNDGAPTPRTCTVFLDANNNGSLDEGEISTTTTGNQGSYTLAGLEPGAYTVVEIPPTGWTLTTPVSRTVNVGAGETAIVDFGNSLPWTSSSYTTSPGTKINDLSTITSQLAVADSYPIVDLNVTVKITHPSVSDLRLTLIAPDGTQVRLVNVGDVSGSNLTNTVFDDEAVKSINQGTAPYTGNFRPVQPLQALDLKTMAGTWKLQILDNVKNRKTGTLNSWTLAAIHETTQAMGAAAAASPAAKLTDAALAAYIQYEHQSQPDDSKDKPSSAISAVDLALLDLAS